MCVHSCMAHVLLSCLNSNNCMHTNHIHISSYIVVDDSLFVCFFLCVLFFFQENFFLSCIVSSKWMCSFRWEMSESTKELFMPHFMAYFDVPRFFINLFVLQHSSRMHTETFQLTTETKCHRKYLDRNEIVYLTARSGKLEQSHCMKFT